MALFNKIPVDKKQIETAISQLEAQTSAELRVYIERKLPKQYVGSSAIERALIIFDELEMHKTQANNAVLIYIGYKDHLCAVIGDKGIHQFVEENFWQTQCELLVQHFKQQQYTLGIVSVIENIGQKLKIHFPIQDDDINELDNEVIIRG